MKVHLSLKFLYYTWGHFMSVLKGVPWDLTFPKRSRNSRPTLYSTCKGRPSTIYRVTPWHFVAYQSHWPRLYKTVETLNLDSIFNPTSFNELHQSRVVDDKKKKNFKPVEGWIRRFFNRYSSRRPLMKTSWRLNAILRSSNWLKCPRSIVSPRRRYESRL